MRFPTRSGEIRREYVSERLAGKHSKEEVAYRQQSETEYKASCAECAYYLSPGQLYSSCGEVAGIVEARNICDLFKARVEEAPKPKSISPKININIIVGKD